MYGSKHVSGYVSPIDGRGSSAGTESGGAGRVRWADFDGDGRADYVILNDNGSARVFLNKGGDGHGGWSDLGKVAGGVTADTSRIKWADIDGDGRADYNIVNPDGSITSYVNHGGDTGGGWTLRSKITTGLTSNQNTVDLADINGDGRADYLVTTGPTTAFLNNGGDDRNNPGWIDYGQIAAGA
ncbi:FG-GAP repeat domain-containing protein [Kitasatospora sp. NPDC001119]